MKKIKTFKILLVAVILVFYAGIAPQIFALKRVDFPNAKLLQPLPQNVQPNISGNIDSSTTPIEPAQEDTSVAREQNPNIPGEGSVGKGFEFYMTLLLGVFLVAFIIIFVYRKNRQR